MKSRNLSASEIEHPLHQLFLSELANMYSAETQLAKALPLMAKAAQSEDLKELLETHLEETTGHAYAAEQIADSLGVRLRKKTSYGMRGLLREGVVATLKNIKSPVLDAALIAAARKIEHYEIASYGTLCRWAREMGYLHELAILISTLNQEKLAHTLLTELAEGAGPLKEVVRHASQRKIRAAVAA